VDSPWGYVQHQTIIAPGITQVSTAGHGGILLSPERQNAMPAALRREHASYEEDCAWSLVAVAFPEEFEAHYANLPWYQGDIIKSAKATVRNFYPSDYEAHFGVTLQPGESMRRDEETFYEAHKDDFVVVSAYGSWHEQVPEGMVGVTAKRGGWSGRESEARSYLVPKREYDQRDPLGFVIDETRHVRIEAL
jgi:hypothetical protein